MGGGESPSLPALIAGHDIELAGSAVGLIPPGHEPLLGSRLGPGDEIVFVASTGLHANGSSLARMIASRLPDRYDTRLPSGRPFGEALLDRSAVYAQLVAALIESDVELHYLSHITGHGLLKLMRPRRDLSYRITRLPAVPEVLRFLAEQVEMTAQEAYSTFNMGCGFAVYCAAGHGEKVVGIAAAQDLSAHGAGIVQEGPRRVLLEEVGVAFESGDMNLSPSPSIERSGDE